MLQKKVNTYNFYLLLLCFISTTFTFDTLSCGPLMSRENGGLLPDSQCPSYFLEMYNVVNVTYNFTNTTTNATSFQSYYYSDINGTIGYCGTPIAQNGQLLTSSETMTYKHHIEIIIPIPWCYSAILFTGRCNIIAGGINPAYPDYFGPSVLYNERPLQTKCRNIYGQGSNITFSPSNIPLWDNGFSGQNTIGTVRVAINDSCTYNATLGLPMIAFDIILQNGFETFPNGSGRAEMFSNNTINNTNSLGKYFYGAYGETTMGTDTGTWCGNLCNTFLTQTCSFNRTIETRETFRPRSVVSLACKDIINGFGFVWRVENVVSGNIHFDWFLFDQIQNNFQLPVATNVSVINISLWNTTTRNIGFDDPLFNGFWLGVAGKRRVSSGRYFYIPTYRPNSTITPTSFARDNVLRPTILDLYAGYPHHYVGSTNLAGIVDFFDMKTFLNMSAFIDFNVSGSSIISSSKNATYRDKNVTSTIRFNSSTVDFYIPKDFVRQIILTVCTKASNVTLTVSEIVNITGVNGWSNLCSHIVNNSKTWSETLSMLFSSFPGILSSATDDPIPICNCSQLTRSPCGSNITGLPDMMKSYFAPSLPLKVNASVFPICKVNQTLVDLIYKTTSGKGSVIFVYNATKISGGDYGYVWGIENLNINSSIQQPGLTSEYVTTQNDLYVKWAFGTFVPPSGNANTTYPLPYPLPDGLEFFTDTNGSITSYLTHDTVIRSGTRRYYFSLASSPHKMYGTFQQLCSSCTNTTPNDPPILNSPYGWSYGYNSSYLASLPDCVCSVNVPCNYGEFVFTVNIDANLSDFVAVAPDPLPPLSYAIVSQSCIPTVEECNGIDDNCDGFVDNIHGYGSVCNYISGLNGTGVCISGNLGCPAYNEMIPLSVNFTLNPELLDVYKLITYKSICHGSKLPSEEICNLLDDNCDGLVDNIVPTNCGSHVLGTCRLGISQCDNLGNKICVGEILPTTEICGDELDNDCDGEIDNGCPSPHNGIRVVNINTKHNNDNTIRNTFSEISSNKAPVKSQYVSITEEPGNFKSYTNDLLSDISNTLNSVYSTAILYLTVIAITVFLLILLCVTGNFGACSVFCGFLPSSPWISLYDTEETTENENIEQTNSTSRKKNKISNSGIKHRRSVF